MGLENSNHSEPKTFGKPGKPIDTRGISYASQFKTYKEAEKQEWANTKKELDFLRKDINAQKNSEVKNLSEAKSLSEFATWLQKAGDKNIKELEQTVGYDKAWKVLLLTYCSTSVDLGKGLLGVLKIGEGAADSAMAFSKLKKKDYNDLAKILYASKGAGIDILNALAIAPAIGTGVKELARHLTKLDFTLESVNALLPRAMQNEAGFVGKDIGATIQKQAEKKVGNLIGKSLDQAFHDNATQEFLGILRQHALSVRNSSFSKGKDIWLDDILRLEKESPGLLGKMKNSGLSIEKDEFGPFLAKKTGEYKEMAYRLKQFPKLNGNPVKSPSLEGLGPIERKEQLKAMKMDEADLDRFSKTIGKINPALGNKEVGHTTIKGILENPSNSKIISELEKSGFTIKQEKFQGDIKYVLRVARGSDKRAIMGF